MKTNFLAFSLPWLVTLLPLTAAEPKPGAPPTRAAVSDEATAIKIAVAAWEPIYGADHIAREKPYRATVRDGVWTVQGSLPRNMKGGVALAEISQADGRVLRIIHGK